MAPQVVITTQLASWQLSILSDMYGHASFMTDVPSSRHPAMYIAKYAWWRHEMETFSALLSICAGNSPVTGEFPAQRPVTRTFDVFFDLRLNKRLSKQSWGWWFETQSRSLWRHCNVTDVPSSRHPAMYIAIYARKWIMTEVNPLVISPLTALMDAYINHTTEIFLFAPLFFKMKVFILLSKLLIFTLIARFMGANMAPIWAPCWPHTLCYLGNCILLCLFTYDQFQ